MPIARPKPWGKFKPPVGSLQDYNNPLSDRLILHILFNEGFGPVVRDLVHGPGQDAGGSTSGEGWRPMVTINSPPWVPNPWGRGLSLNGTTQYVDCGGVYSLDTFGSRPFSGAAWIYQPNPTAYPYGDIISRMDDSGWVFNTLNRGPFQSTSICFFMQDLTQTRNMEVNGGTVLAANTWYFAGFSYDGSKTAAGVKLYLNGKPLAMTTTFDQLLVGDRIDSYPRSLRIGARFAGGAPYGWYNGQIDQVRMWNRVVTANEFRELYTNPFADVIAPSRRRISRPAAAFAVSPRSVASAVRKAVPYGRIKPPQGTPLNRGHPLSQGLKALWMFDEAMIGVVGNNQPAIDIAGSNHLTNYGNIPGCIGAFGFKGRQFNGANQYFYADYPTPPTARNFGISGDDCFTMVAWICPTNIATNCQIIKIGNGAIALHVAYMAINATGELAFSTGGPRFGTANNFLQNNQWYHVVCSKISHGDVFDTYKMWVNGVEPTYAATASGTQVIDDRPIGIGSRYDGNTAAGLFPGRIDHIRIYNRGLRQEEAMWLYREPFADFVEPRRKISLATTAATYAKRRMTFPVSHWGRRAPFSWTVISPITTARAATTVVGTAASAAVIAGETDNTETAFTNSVQIWNNVSWSAGTVTPVARGSSGGAGTVTAALCFGGRTAITTPINSTIQGDATVSWSAGGNMSGTARALNGSCGTQTAALHVGGYRDGGGSLFTVESYNGTTWSAGTNIVGNNFGHVLLGTATDAYAIGSASYTQGTQGYNGSAWTAGQNILTGRGFCCGTGTGASAAIIAGGTTGSAISSSERFATSWVSVASLNTPKYNCQGCGTNDSALCVGGYIAGGGSGVTNVVERYGPAPVLPPGWATGGSVGTGRMNAAGAGTAYDSMLVFGGCDAGGTSRYGNTDAYNGSSFTAGGTMSRARQSLAGCGSVTAALSVAGDTATVENATETYNGSVWTTQGTVVTARQLLAAVGTPTAAINFGGGNHPGTTDYGNTESFNGTTWSNTANSLAANRYGHPGCGTSTNALAVAGSSATVMLTSVESWNGTVWAAEAAIGSAEGRYRAGNGGGTGRGDCYVVAGYNGSAKVTTTTYYNGTAWIARSTIPAARQGHGTGGSSSSMTIACGQDVANAVIASAYSYH